MDEGSTVQKHESAAEDVRESSPTSYRVVPPPADGSVLWKPVKMGLSGARVSSPHDIYLSQKALRDLQAHILGEGDPEKWGLLIGEACRAPESGEVWVIAREARPAAEPLPEEAGVQTAAAAISGFIDTVSSEDVTAVGWYHSHSLLGAFLSERDAKVHAHCFPEPWQFAVVEVVDAGRPAGGVFGRTEWGALLRGVYLPFRELLAGDSVLADGRKVTSLGWVNYTAEEETVPEEVGAGLPRAVAAEEEVQLRIEPEQEGEEEEAPPEAEPAGKEKGLETRLVADSAEIARLEAARAEAAAASAKSKAAAVSPDPAFSPPGGAVRPPAGTPHEPHYEELPVVMPPKEAADLANWRTWKRPGVAVLAVVLVAAAWLVWGRFASGGSPGVIPPAPASSAGTAPGTSGSAAASGPPSFGQAPDAFGTLNARFLEAAGQYRDRGGNFDTGQVGCEGLKLVYRRADEAFLALSEKYAQDRDQLGGTQTAAYQSAAREMESVDRHFDASGCPRPE